MRAWDAIFAIGLAIALPGCATLMGGCPPRYDYGGASATFVYENASLSAEALNDALEGTNLTILDHRGELIGRAPGQANGVATFRWREGPENVTGETRFFATSAEGPIEVVNVTLGWRDYALSASEEDIARHQSKAEPFYARDAQRLAPFAAALREALAPSLGEPTRVANAAVVSTVVC